MVNFLQTHPPIDVMRHNKNKEKSIDTHPSLDDFYKEPLLDSDDNASSLLSKKIQKTEICHSTVKKKIIENEEEQAIDDLFELDLELLDVYKDKWLNFLLQNGQTFFAEEKNTSTEMELDFNEAPTLTNEQKALVYELVSVVENANFEQPPLKKLRNYQIQAIQAIPKYFLKEEMGGYFRIPTGGGKTLIMMNIANLLRKKTLIIVPTLLLVDQTIEVAKNFFEANVPIFSLAGKTKPSLEALRQPGFCICVTTYQSMITRIQKETTKATSQKNNNDQLKTELKTFPLVLLDEYHHAMDINITDHSTKEENAWISLAKQFPNLMLGFTATPKFCRIENSFSQKLILDVSIYSLIYLQYLAPLISSVLRIPIDLPRHHKKAMEEKPKPDAQDFLQLKQIICDILLHVKTPCGKNLVAPKKSKNNPRILIFCNRQADVKAIKEYINETFGRTVADYITAETPPDLRARIINSYRKGYLSVLLGCKAFIEGFDLPIIQVVFIFDPTHSRMRARQCVGRALRTATNKEYAWVVNVYPLGDPDGYEQITVPDLMDGKAIVGPENFIRKVRTFNCKDQTRTTQEGTTYTIEYPEGLRPEAIPYTPGPFLNYGSFFFGNNIPLIRNEPENDRSNSTMPLFS